VSESQLLFINIRQRELVRVLASLVYLLIHILLGLVRVLKVGQYKAATLTQSCKDLSAKCLKVPLNVRVDKENSLESLFIWSIYLYTILLVCALLSCTFM